MALEQAQTILVADDDREIVELMRDFLTIEGFRVVAAADGEEALSLLDGEHVDCILLDVGMPRKSGFDLCREVRETRDVPIIFLSARGEDRDKIRGLGLGGDDYIVKSATPSEVVARIRAVLRRYRRAETAAKPPTVLDFGRVVLDVRAREVRVDGKVVPFTGREFELFRLLAEHPRQVFTKEQLFERIWGDHGERHTVTVHIGRIREKIELDPDKPQYITTIWGIGYRFEGGQR